MPKPKKPVKQKSLNDAFDGIDKASLVGGLRILEASEPWALFQAFIYHQAAGHGTASNILVQETGKEKEACAAGAKAEVLREVADQFMNQLKERISGYDGVVEQEIPEE